MTREILFRGFHKDENGKETIYLNGEEIKGKWVYGYPFLDYDETISIVNKPNDEHENVFYFEVIPETVGQYTGLDDKNGKKIFENDVIKCTSPNTLFIEYAVVLYSEKYGKFEVAISARKEDSEVLGFYISDLCEDTTYEVTRTIFDKEVK